jgi:hypothetical protein
MAQGSSLAVVIANQYVEVSKRFNEMKRQRTTTGEENAEISRFFDGMAHRFRGQQDALLGAFRIVAIAEGLYSPPKFDPTQYVIAENEEGGPYTADDAMDLDDTNHFFRMSDLLELEECIVKTYRQNV